MSSPVREWCEETEDDLRERVAVDMKPEMSGRLLNGGTNTVEREPLLRTPLLFCAVFCGTAAAYIGSAGIGYGRLGALGAMIKTVTS